MKRIVSVILMVFLLVSMFTFILNPIQASSAGSEPSGDRFTTSALDRALTPRQPDFCSPSGLVSEKPEASKPFSLNVEGDDVLSVAYHFSKPKINGVGLPNSQYLNVTVDNCFQYGDAGNPILPYRTAKIAIPQGRQFENLSVVGERETVLPGYYLVDYGRESLPLSMIESASSQITDSPNQTVYTSTEPFPGKLYSESSVQHKMGYDIVLLDLFPVQYVPKNGKLSYCESIRVEIQTARVEETQPHPNLCLLQYEILRSAVDNPEAIEYSTSEQTSTCEYVIVTNEELNNTPGPYNLQALRDDKISRGITAKIVTVEWIYTNYNGTRPDGQEDNQTKIRNFIIDAYRNLGTIYVLLAGDDPIIPHRGFYVNTTNYIDYDIPADVYYSCLDGTFDYNHNGIYGEPNDGPNGGEVDLLAEVYVGRACVDSQTKVQNFVRKTLSYQSTPNTQDLKKVCMVGQYLGFGGIADWGGNYKDEIKYGSNAYGYNTTGFMNSAWSNLVNLSTLYDRDYPGNNWPETAIINIINDNVNLVNHVGHANDGYLMKMTNYDVDNLLTNDRLYFVGYSWGCDAGAFDLDCIVEHLTTGAHGAVAFVANSRYGFGTSYSTDGPSQHYDRQFWDAVLGENITNIGIANQDSKEDNAGRVGQDPYDRWCFYEINLFGDPELNIKLPSADEHDLKVKLECPAYLDPGQSSWINATVQNRGLANESQLKLLLMIDDTIVLNKSISSLATGAAYTTSFLWTPMKEAIYNVTAYAPPVQGEYKIADNIGASNVVVNLNSLLVVNDNDGSSFINGTSFPAVKSALVAAGYNYLVWNESLMGNPPLYILIRFRMLIWTCGDYWNKAVDSIDAASLNSYLANGGAIFIEGEDIGFDHSGDSFMTNVAHAKYQVDNTAAPGLTVTATNHPVVQGLPLSITWTSKPSYPDGVTPANLGTEVAMYIATNWSAITVFEGQTSRVVYCAFPLFCLNSSQQELLIRNSASWLLKPPAKLAWTKSTDVSQTSEDDTRSTMATDSNGFLYAAFEHQNLLSGYYEIYVSKSTDHGKTWSTIQSATDNHNLGHPSIAIDVGDNDNIFVAFEREWTLNDHDIFVLRCINGSWSIYSVANARGNDDRYPSITCEYQYGANDRQYISYEYVPSYDDRDLMFASSVNDGASWSLQQIHGGNWLFPDYNVHCQSCITTTRDSDGFDYIYIAYKWGADYNTAYDIVIDKSKDRGSTWTQQWVCNEASHDKNWPSISATHGGGTVVIAWHVYCGSTYLDDIQYAYSTDNGGSWYVTWLAFEANADETNPTITVDGQGSPSNNVYGCIHVAYWKDNEICYKKASFDSPWLWTETETIANSTASLSSDYKKLAITTYKDAEGRYLPALAWADLRGKDYEVYCSRAAVQRNLTVVSAHDAPSPPVGNHQYSDGDFVTCTVDSPVTEDGIMWTCVGWVGAGSVPSSGSGTSAVFKISDDSSITWNWQSLVIPNAHMIVRGTDSRIYYRVWNGTDWQRWNVLPGSTLDSPAAAMLGNELHVVVRGSDGSSLWYGYLTNTTDPGSFSGWTLLSGATSSAPTLTSNGTALCLVVRGLDNCIYCRCYDGSWCSWHAIPTGATCDSPAATMLGNDLHIVVRGMDQLSLWDTIISCDGTVVRDWRPVSGATFSKPCLTSSQGSNKLYLAVRGLDNRIYYRDYSGSSDSWGEWSALPGATCDGPAATVVSSELCVVVRGMDGGSLWCGDVDLGTNNFSGWILISGATPSAPTLTS